MRKLFGLTVAALLALGCGVTEEEQETAAEPQVASTEEELALMSDRWVTVRPDLRMCPSPRCGGHWVKDVNQPWARELYVRALDFSVSGLTEEWQAKARAAAAGELVLLGRLGKPEMPFGTRVFLVKQAYRGLPGVTPAAGEQYLLTLPLNILCVRAPCPTMRVQPLNLGGEVFAHGVRVQRALLSFVDGEWVARVVQAHGAVVVGRLVPGDSKAPGGELLLDASQVFVRLPFYDFPCPLMRAIRPCPNGTVLVYERSADRCLFPVGCVRPGPCLAYFPVCAPGYTLDSWPARPNGCPAWACDPTFTVQ
ncbi:MAG: DUF6748 domain-containing protein [Myxococcota bacterium]